MAAVVTGAHSGIGLVLARLFRTDRRKPKLDAAMLGVGQDEKGIQGTVASITANAAAGKS